MDALLPPAALTPAMRRVMIVLQRQVDGTGVAPTVREIATELGATSHSEIQYRLDRIAARGWIRRTPGQARAITILHRLPASAADGETS